MQYPKTWAAWRRCSHRLFGTVTSTDAHPVAPEHDALYKDYILRRYTEPQRHYHTMQHLEDMLIKTEAYFDSRQAAARHRHKKAQPASPRSPRAAASCSTSPAASAPSHTPPWLTTLVLELSILFHDVVYDPKRGDNEEASARLVRELLKTHVVPSLVAARCNADDGVRTASSSTSPRCTALHAPAQTIHGVYDPWQTLREIETRVCANIEQTKYHLAVAPVAVWQPTASSHAQTQCEEDEDPTDTQLLMDVDLAVLGSGTWEDYARYAAAVRQEYNFYAPADFVAGRSAFLASFLAKPQWFKTAYFYYRYEARARVYTQRELETLTMRGADDPSFRPSQL